MLDESMSAIQQVETEGSDVLLTCVVRQTDEQSVDVSSDSDSASEGGPLPNSKGPAAALNRAGLSVIWRSQRGAVLTAGDTRYCWDRVIKI